MGIETNISWTDSTFSPWWGCAKVSPGCKHCYADTFARRVGHGARLPTIWGPQSERRTFGAKHWNDPIKWNAKAEKAGKRHRVFCSSMADVFEDRRDLDAERAKLWPLIAKTPWLDWQLLTKRPENMRKLAPPEWANAWPANVWAGCTVESHEYAYKRIPFLLDVPAKVRFLSCEPLLGPVDLWPFIDPVDGGDRWSAIDWVIVGGESGGGSRPFNLVWARTIVQQCRRAEVACWVKQLGADPIDGLAGCSVPFKARKADDPSEWPEELRIQEMPA